MAATTVVRTGPAAMFPSGVFTALMLPSLIRLSVTPRSEAVSGPDEPAGAGGTPVGAAEPPDEPGADDAGRPEAALAPGAGAAVALPGPVPAGRPGSDG